MKFPSRNSDPSRVYIAHGPVRDELLRLNYVERLLSAATKAFGVPIRLRHLPSPYNNPDEVVHGNVTLGHVGDYITQFFPDFAIRCAPAISNSVRNDHSSYQSDSPFHHLRHCR